MEYRGRVAVSLLLLTGVGVPAISSPVAIPGLVNTGANGNGGVLPDAATDPHWQVLSLGQPGVVVSQAFVPVAWLPNSDSSRWIWASSNGTPTRVTYIFRTVFDLTGLDPSTALVTGRWTVDNFGLDIVINGVSTGQTIGGNNFGRWFDFTVASGFVNGLNTLDFVVQDVGSIAGFRAELSGTAVVPTPGVASALAAGALFAARRRRN